MVRWSLLSAVLLASPAAGAATFAFDDARYLRNGESEGGLVHAPPNAAGELPLLVFLHGVNEAGPLHRGLGAGSFDLRVVVDELRESGSVLPLAVGGPSQTKEAWTGSRLWSGFDLDAFVEAVESSLATARVDRARVIVAGHSGAGCNPTGGLLAPTGKVIPLAMLVLDTCMDANFGKLFGEATERSAVHVFFQTSLWQRDFAGFRTSFDAARSGRAGSIARLDVGGENPHDELVPSALRKALPTLLPVKEP